MYNDDVINAVIEAVNKYAGKKIGDATPICGPKR